MLALIDNRDSFTFNLAQAFSALGAEVRVLEAASTRLSTLRRLRPERLVLGPGPGGPEAARFSREALEAFAPQLPTLGVCLGFQVAGQAFGARVQRARTPMHGHTTRVRHDGRGLFSGLPSPLACARYNSLALLDEDWPECLELTARSEEGEPMAFRHREWPLSGVQFHPESILSERGMELLQNFLRG